MTSRRLKAAAAESVSGVGACPPLVENGPPTAMQLRAYAAAAACECATHGALSGAQTPKPERARGFGEQTLPYTGCMEARWREASSMPARLMIRRDAVHATYCAVAVQETGNTNIQMIEI